MKRIRYYRVPVDKIHEQGGGLCSAEVGDAPLWALSLCPGGGCDVKLRCGQEKM